MKKFKLLFLTILVIVAEIILFGTKSNATNIEEIKKTSDFANGNIEYNIRDYGNDEKAINLTKQILPNYWTIRDYKPDYGIDLAIETFDDNTFSQASRNIKSSE